MVTIIADEGYKEIGEKLKNKLLDNKVDVDYISLENVNVEPCISCGGCTFKSYGKCVIRDDGDWIYPKLIRSDVQIYGMPYTHTHESGLDLLEMFSKKCNVKYMGGFVMGLGAMLNGSEINMLPHGKRVERQLDIFFDHINKNEQVPKSVYEKAALKMPSVIYKVMAKGMNKKIDKDLKSRGIDVNQTSPYLTNK